MALTCARSRFLFGHLQPTRLSRFIDDLTRDDIEVVSMPVSCPAGGRSEYSPSSERGPSGSRRRPAAAPSSRSHGRKIAATVQDGDGTGWRPGDRVRHRRFGSGVILACRGTGAQLKLVVYFDRAGRKTLVPTIAKLEKI